MREIKIETQSKLLVETKDQVESAIITDVLGQNGIKSFAKPREPGALDAYVGYVGEPVYGEAVYVEEADYERAKELVAEVLPTDAEIG